jgi:hypothetical protein
MQTLDLHEAPVAELEKLVDTAIADTEKIGAFVVPVLVELYERRAWENHKVPIGVYFRDFRGIGGQDGFRLSRKARHELVKRIPDPKAVAHVGLMSGYAVRTIDRDRSDLGIANPNMVNARKGHARVNPDPAGDDADLGGSTRRAP